MKKAVVNRKIVINGFIASMEKDKRGNVLQVAIEADDFTRYIIANDLFGLELFEHLNERVSVKGVITGEDLNDNKIITVKEYEVIESKTMKSMKDKLVDKKMKIVVAYSSKEGLLIEYKKRTKSESKIPDDFFAEGDSPETIQAILGALRDGGFDVSGIEADDQAAQQLERLQPDLVFNVAEGLYGDFRESYIPIICERLGIPYTGSDPLMLGICLNKVRTKEILSYYSIPNPAFRVFYPGQEIELGNFVYPAIIKPVAEGSSKGIYDNSVVDQAVDARERIQENLLTYRQPVLMEKFLSGDEYTVAVWGNGSELEVLPIVSIHYGNLPEGARPIYSYEAKWIWDTPQKPLEIFQCPAAITESRQREIEVLARNVVQVLGIKDWCRIDIRIDEKGVPNILELNPLPGILPKVEDNSCFPKAARTAGYSYQEMLVRVIRIGMKRYGFVE